MVKRTVLESECWVHLASSFISHITLKVKVKWLSCVRLFATSWTVAYQALPSVRFSLNTLFQFSSVAPQCPTLRDPINRSTPGLPVHHNSRSSLRLTSIESVMPSSHLILCRPLLLSPPIPPSIRVFSFLKKNFF